MKVAIIGGGAVGLLIAAYISKAKMEPIIYTRREEQALALNEQGLKMYKNGIAENFAIKALPISKGLSGEEEIVIVTVKQYDVKKVIDFLSNSQITKPILFLQNGMGHLTYLSELSSPSIYVGIVEHGVLRYSDTCIAHTGEGQIKVAPFKEKTASFDRFVKELDAIGFRTIMEENWYPVLVKKLIVNAVINPLTALYKVKNGALLTNQSFYNNMIAIFQEVTCAVELKDVSKVWDEVVAICKKTSENFSSMYKDIENNRPTEIDSILGYLLAEGKKNSMNMPLTSFLYNSIKGMENKREGEGNG
ncbi:2-dehydropantoate 2-reductase [Calidifontibacillus erzurumensis]|uniref:2-dehydropantoate 2-reductase n=1 Tax=Calidifontibacillus erzurumensis TaxID=2741433 RepID=A0A8J8KB76_9BACI|nr:2-dehydropantoate 2-reductase [Calidifontibacillus erzurumensis]NSL50768.1 2-dehydropantoate 2-reductase [Calidifontibacillus erzurumensis]